MKSSEIRQRFLDFFARHGHTPVASSPLVPGNDPTLLFTNAGMVQFKDVFLGRETRPYARAVSSQRCVRAGGKHNDLENVGYTARHHTFFEMLGNFSFGDYFKRNAIQFAWEFLTQELGIAKDKLWITVYHTDDEAHTIWTAEMGVPDERVIRIGDKPGGGSDNFWQMGDTGPCGPCTEIFYDHGAEVAGGPPGSADEDGDRYIEIWNLVFMQFNRDEAGNLQPLPRPSVDTGMGLERISAVMQHVHSNYEIDLFQALIHAAARVTGSADLTDNSLKVIADHIRACAFLITDGIIPGNEGRGYVLRRIIRRAIRHGYQLGQKQPFFHLLVADLAMAMGAAYPELVAAQARVTAVLKQEEERFAETLEHGMDILEQALQSGANVLDGATAFKLYDTYGFPLDLTADVGRERGFTVDMAGFEAAMEAQRKRARAASKFTMQAGMRFDGPPTEFRGYDTLSLDSRILALYQDGSPVHSIAAGEAAVIVLDRTPFYAESGGQVGDSGELHGSGSVFVVDDTQKIQPDVFGHTGLLQSGSLKLGDTVSAQVDADARSRAACNHSATHLLHAALRQVLGTHVTQKGSLVDAARTRFDFAHSEAVSAAQLQQIEDLVNREIRRNVIVEARLMNYDAAIAHGAMALFGEKYGDQVRVIGMGEFSTELCGGTHVSRSGDIGLFKIISESGVAAGIRRIEAVTGPAALAMIQAQQRQILEAAALLKAPPQELQQKIAQIVDNVKNLEKELDRLKSRLAAAQGDDLVSQATAVGNAKVLAAMLEGADVKTLRETVDKLKDRLKSCAVVLGSCSDGRVTLVAGVSADLTSKVKAGELANFVASQVGGKGGGRPDMAQAGGTEPAQLPAALQSVAGWVAQRLE
ncbi:alanine--tRNA ligase [Sulfuriferula plumbiphila]|uniref:Alanine--tRNA ligase n=1 Tax=Sulfuriferula plumbiphila TaxID=171865 RepID=A0A512L3U7_9PROT|nr:alanine--tRNA ligase [Sulfuriferula plumbiphila]BBP05557.1 alanine--tRNA ligase [Sulfuriferula plumbiphila]GEP29146.1 alanine--tRNA ligase [Sulfuriferula plumbiphila]